MNSRRRFLQDGLALSACCLSGGAAAAAALPSERLPQPTLPIAEVVFDRRMADCRSFARAAARLGVPLQSISADVTALWYDDLYHRWKDPTACIAGMTGVSALFCLEQLGRSAERRVVLRVEHTRRADSHLDHLVRAPPALSILPTASPRSAWPARMARLALSVPAHAGPAVWTLHLSSPALASGRDDWEEPLVSWVLAPRRLLQPQ